MAFSDCAMLHPSIDPDDEGAGMGFGLDMGPAISMDEMDGMNGDEAQANAEHDDAFVDADVEAIQTMAAQGVNGELELSETGRVRSDFVNNSRYQPY